MAAKKKTPRKKRPPRTIYHRFSGRHGIFNGEPYEKMKEAEEFKHKDEDIFVYVLAERVRQK